VESGLLNRVRYTKPRGAAKPREPRAEKALRNTRLLSTKYRALGTELPNAELLKPVLLKTQSC
jgi:hypothetical protein